MLIGIISGEYLGWNAKNLTFINCTIDSICNPSGGRIRAADIRELIMDASMVDVTKTMILTTALKEAV